jgi:hypothetical protein
MKDPYWFHKTVTWFPGAEVILHQAGFKISTSFYKIKLWLSEIDPPRAFCLWSSDASVVITSRRARHIQGNDWAMRSVDMDHILSGGATDGRWGFFVYTRHPSTFEPISAPSGL